MFSDHIILKNKKINITIFLIFLSFAIRVPIILLYGDSSLDHEWKHLVGNLILHGQLVYESIDGYLLPNLWMPPLYAYYIYFFSFFGLENENFIFLILLSQALLAAVSVVAFYKISKIFFSKKISICSSLIFSLFPLHVYSSSQISSINLQIPLILLFIYFFFTIKRSKKNISILIFSLLSGLNILLRAEFQAIFIFSIIYLYIFFKIPIKKIFLIIFITLITLSPYLIRNYIIFEKVTLAKTFGYNLWKGNHPHAMKNSLVEGSELFDENLKKKSAKIVDGFIILESIPRDINYRFKFNNFFLNQAINNISKEPINYLIFYFKKAASFILIDIKSSDPDYYNPLHYLPVLFFGIISLVGIILSNKKSSEFNFLILIFFSYIFIFSSVSILPRYKLIILPMQLLFTNVIFRIIGEKYFQSKKIR